MERDTVAAISTAASAGGIGIVRISGPSARAAADRIFKSKSGKKIADTPGYHALYGHVYDGKDPVDEVIALVFAAPKSYTGEDVVELSAHGGRVVLKKILRLCCENGARLAEPGEFTKRAFLNGKMDLTEAEGVMDIIGAKSEDAAKAALFARDGALSKELSAIKEEILSLSAWLSAWADFPEEDIPEVENEALLSRISLAKGRLQKLVDTFDRGQIVKSGVDTVIAGRTNAGKSTLMNLLCGRESSIVTEIEGTTRDVITEEVALGDIILKISDTAGLRETSDPVEKFGIDRARKRAGQAQLVLAVFDRSKELSPEDRELCELCVGRPAVAVINKTDLEGRLDEGFIREKFSHVVGISAKEGEGLELLSREVEKLFSLQSFDPTAAMISNERQLECALRALKSLEQSECAVKSGITLDAVSVCLDDSLAALMELTGERVTEQVSNRVFHNFCVGK